VGQIYLLDNPLLRQPLRPEHVKPRLLGHWGTTPGLTFIYAHMNRAIRARGLSTIFVTGPGHGGPGLVAAAYLDGTYSEVYPHIARDEEGLRRLASNRLSAVFEVTRGLSADRPARPVQLLRGVHPHHRRHVQPACQVA
jgi:phosphoketolase